MQTAAAIAAAILSLAAASSRAQADAGGPQASVPPRAAPSVAGVKVTAKKGPDDVVCIRRQQSDSRIPGPSECHTRRVWDQMTGTARDETQGLQQRSLFFNR